jgi:TolB-like protein
MASLIPGYEYDIFISYRQKDNKGDRWVSEFVEALKTELESTFKEEISVYFDINPHDGLLETHDVDASLKDKLKCLVFIPIISRTYCDPKSFAWEHEFKAFVDHASHDQFGLKIKLPNGNVANRIIPVQIHELHLEDKTLIEKELGGVLRAIEFIYKETGVNRPLSTKDNEEKNSNKTNYRNQINKVANALDEVIHSLKEKQTSPFGRKLSTDQTALSAEEDKKKDVSPTVLKTKKSKRWMIISLAVLFFVVGLVAIYKFITSGKKDQKLSIEDKSIAVLPFVNDSPDKDNEYFCNGMMEEILNQLQKISDLNVKSRTSVEKYRNTDKDIKVIGHELGVSFIIEGSVRKIGDDLRITAQLIDIKTGNHLWSQPYDGKYTTKIFEFQSSVAKKVAASLNAVITPLEEEKINTKPVTNMLVYDLGLKGSEMMYKFGSTLDTTYLKLALNIFDQVLKIDPKDRGALNSKFILYRDARKYDSAVYYIEKINRLYPNNSWNMMLLGTIYFYTNQPDSAVKYEQMAVNNDPNEPWANFTLGQVLVSMKNDVINALPYYQKAYDLQKDNYMFCNGIAWAYRYIGDYKKALKYSNKSILMRSEFWVVKDHTILLAYNGKYDESLSFLDSICNINAFGQQCDMMKFYIKTIQKDFKIAEEYYNKAKKDGYKIVEDDNPYIAYFYKETDRDKEAISILKNSITRDEDKLLRSSNWFEDQRIKARLAASYALLGENKKALHYFSESGDLEISESLFSINKFPGFDNLRSDTQFKAIVKRIEDQRAATRVKVREMEESGELHL